MNVINNLKITDTAYGGYGVGRSDDGQVIFTPYTVEGDTVDVKIVDDKKNFAYGQLVRIIKPSLLRIKPDCPYAGKCGGCLFAHIFPKAQIDIKLKIIRNAFRKYPDPMPNIVTHLSPVEGYRIRATVRARKGVTGFFAFKSNDFIPVDNCRVIKPSLFEKIKSFAMVNNITGEIDAIETPSGLAFASVKSETELKDRYPFDGIKFNDKSHGLKYTGFNTHYGTIGIGCGSFFQANGFLMDEFQQKAVSFLRGGLSVVELYAGAGFFTSGLMKINDNVRGVECSEQAVSLGVSYGYPIEKGDAGDFLQKIKEIDVIFLDPPRDGVSNKVIDNIKRLLPFNIIYVSCNPITLARDIVKLSGDYIIKSYDVYNMFPDTYHVENIVLLEKRGNDETIYSQ